MAWSLWTVVEAVTDILQGRVPPRLMMGQDPTADPMTANAVTVGADGSMHIYSTPDYHTVVGAEVDPINAGGVYLTGWVDVRDYALIGVYIHNTGAVNPITQIYIYQSPDGVDTGVGAGITVSIAATTGQMIYISAANSASVVFPECPAGYIRVVAISAAGTKGRATIVAKR